MRTEYRWIALILLCSALVGCSGGPKLVPVKGKLTMNGKPLKNVKVDFQPDPDKSTTGPGSSGTTDEGGNFTLICSAPGNRPGALLGHHRVILEDLDLYGTEFVGRGDYRAEDGKGGKMLVSKKPRFSVIYSKLANTPLKQEVKEGMGSVTIDIK